MATNCKHVDQLRCGNIKATIWQNVSEKGPFFSTTFSRPFKGQSAAWRNGTSFGLNDLEALVTIACDAKEWIAAHALKHRAASLRSLRPRGLLSLILTEPPLVRILLRQEENAIAKHKRADANRGSAR